VVVAPVVVVVTVGVVVTDTDTDKAEEWAAGGVVVWGEK
jgi:hypothetical protein